MAAQSGVPDWRKAFAAARVHVETQLQHQLERGDVVRERRRYDLAPIVGGEFRDEVWPFGQHAESKRFIGTLTRSKKLPERTAREKELVDLAAAMAWQHQQDRSSLEPPPIDVTWRNRRVSGPTDARQAARIGVHGSFDEALVAKCRRMKMSTSALHEMVAAQLRVADRIGRRRSVIDTSSIDLAPVPAVGR